jgi:hypothetical protein
MFHKYKVTLEVGSKQVIEIVFASCTGNAIAVARGQLGKSDYDLAKVVSVFTVCR